MFTIKTYASAPSPTPVHDWNGSTCVFIAKIGDGTGGGWFLTAGHTGGNTGVKVNDYATDGRTKYTITEIHEHPEYDAKLLKTSSNVSALTAPSLGNTVPAFNTPVLMGGYGRTATVDGGWQYPRAERWVSNETNTPVLSGMLSTMIVCTLSPLASSTDHEGSACMNDSGGGIFSDDGGTLLGLIVQATAPVTSGGEATATTSALTTACLLPWIQSTTADTAAPFVFGHMLDATNLKVSVHMSAACTSAATGGEMIFANADATKYYSNVSGSPEEGSSAASVLTFAIEENESPPLTPDAGTSSFAAGVFVDESSNQSEALTSVAWVDGNAGASATGPIPVQVDMTLPHDDTGGTATIRWDRTVTDNATGNPYALWVAPNAKYQSLGTYGSGSGTDTTTHVVPATASSDVDPETEPYGTLTFNPTIVSDGVNPNQPASGIAVTTVTLTDIPLTSNAGSVASATMSAINRAHYWKVTADQSGTMTLTVGGTISTTGSGNRYTLTVFDLGTFLPLATLASTSTDPTNALSFACIGGVTYGIMLHKTGMTSRTRTLSIATSPAAEAPAETAAGTGGARNRHGGNRCDRYDRGGR